MRLPQRRTARDGATIVEAAIIMTVLLALILGMLDLGIAVQRQHLLSQAARQAARQAMVHGKMAPQGWNGGPWGVGTINVPANAAGIPIVAAVQPLLVGCDLSQTNIIVEWPDGKNEVQSPVRVTVQSPYQPIVTFIFGNPTVTLTATSTVPIAH